MRKILSLFLSFALVLGISLTAVLTSSLVTSKSAVAGPPIETGGSQPISGGSPVGSGGSGVGNPGTGGNGNGGNGGNGGGSAPAPRTYLTNCYYTNGVASLDKYEEGRTCAVNAPDQYRTYPDNPGGQWEYGDYINCPVASGNRSAVSVTTYYEKPVVSAGSTWQLITRYTCNYPTVASTQPIILRTMTCYYNFGGAYAMSQDRPTIRSGGTILGTRPSDQPAPSPLNGSKITGSISNCNTNQNSVWYRADTTDYGYYRIVASLTSKVYTQWGWPSWMNRAETWWAAGSPTNSVFTNYYTYSCSVGGGQVFEGPTTHAGLPGQGTRIFDPSSCRMDTWTCGVSGSVDINGTHANIEVMRNGANVPLKLPSVNPSGTVRNANGTDSPVAQSDIQWRLSVIDGSSPFNGTDANASNQFFKLIQADGSKTEKFNVWRTNPNDNTSKFMQYLWASDNGKNHSLRHEVKFNAQFLVPRADYIGGPVYYTWVNDAADCPTQESNKITVVRSINSYTE